VPGSEQPAYNGFSATAPIAMAASGKEKSTTKSGISGADITITDEAGQQAKTGKSAEETIASLNRDVSTDKDTSGALKPIFDEKQIQTGFEITSALVRETGTFLNNRAQEATAAKAALDQELAKPKAEQDPARIASLTQTLKDNETWAPGGTSRMIVTAITAAAGGNVTGSSVEMLQGAAVNYLQSLGVQQVKGIADSLMTSAGEPTAASEAVRTALQGLVACAGVAAQSQSCGASATGAAASVVLNNLIQGLDGKDAASLTPAEKEARTNLVSSLVAGIAAAAGGEAAVSTAAATIEMENNYLSPKSSALRVAAKSACDADPSNSKACGIVKTLDRVDQETKQQLNDLVSDCQKKIPGSCDQAQALIDARNRYAVEDMKTCPAPYNCAGAYQPSAAENMAAQRQLPGWGSGQTTPTIDPITAAVMVEVGLANPAMATVGGFAAGGAELINQRRYSSAGLDTERIANAGLWGFTFGGASASLTSWWSIGAAGGASSGVTTAYNNNQTGSKDSVVASTLLGFGFSAAARGAADFGALGLGSALNYTRAYDSTLPALVQPVGGRLTPLRNPSIWPTMARDYGTPLLPASQGLIEIPETPVSAKDKGTKP
jgi:hypothetical protein